MQRRKLLILYTEPANYTIACLRALDPQKVEVHFVRWPVNKEAPFRFSFPENVRVYERSDYNGQQLLSLAEKIAPDAILCSGWIDKEYLAVCRAFAKKAVTILTMDNKWQGTLRQRLATIVARFRFLPVFRFIWVPGGPQKRFAQKLGFPERRIRTGFYSADVPFFRGIFLSTREKKQQHFPHRVIYAGRYYEFKGVHELWNAFAKVSDETKSDWELWCLGTGDAVPAKHPKIRHFGFVQPSEMEAFLRDTGVYVLPSRVEPWGVAVHEFAAAGFPLLLSRNVGAAAAFLDEGKNGFTFSAASEDELVAVFRRLFQLDDATLAAMGERSAEKALQITPATWAETLQEMIEQQP